MRKFAGKTSADKRTYRHNQTSISTSTTVINCQHICDCRYKGRWWYSGWSCGNLPSTSSAIFIINLPRQFFILIQRPTVNVNYDLPRSLLFIDSSFIAGQQISRNDKDHLPSTTIYRTNKNMGLRGLKDVTAERPI